VNDDEDKTPVDAKLQRGARPVGGLEAVILGMARARQTEVALLWRIEGKLDALIALQRARIPWRVRFWIWITRPRRKRGSNAKD
jgi:hypothetical protein